MSDFTEDVFDEKKVQRAIKKGKRKTIMIVTLITIIVFVVLIVANFAISAYFSHKAFKQWDAYVKLSSPNSYISKTVDSRGILGGMSHYKISKDMKIKSLVTEQKQYSFGLNPSVLISRGSGGKIGVTGKDWQTTYKENGWRDLMFFHPNVDYKKYKHDENLMKDMDEEKIYEVALSFDQPYKQSDLPFSTLPEMTWLWVDTYSDSQLSTLQEEAKEHDWSATFIREDEALGFSTNETVSSTTDLEYEYDEFLELLKTSHAKEHKDAYNRMKDKKVKDVEVLGAVVYGTKKEIVDIIKNPSVKASSLGGIVDDY